MVTLVRPLTRSSSKITNRSLRYAYAALCLWNELPTDLREPRQTQSPALSPYHMAVHHLHHLHYHRLHLLLVFHSEVKTWLFGKSFPPLTFSFPTGLIPWTLGPFSVFILLNGWICLHGVFHSCYFIATRSLHCAQLFQSYRATMETSSRSTQSPRQS